MIVLTGEKNNGRCYNMGVYSRSAIYTGDDL